MSCDITELHKEIDLIQACITRMADCSFKLKAGYISLISLSLTLLIGQKCDLLIIGLFILVITTIFWYLDAFFLRTETLYRWKYDWVVKHRKQGKNEHLYDLDPYNQSMWDESDSKNTSFMKFLFSKTLIPLYGIMWIVAILLVVNILLDRSLSLLTC